MVITSDTIEYIKNSVNTLGNELMLTKYGKSLKNKKVIIVGPDPRILGQDLGKQIENYDVIIRLNTTINYIPFSKELCKDIGSRTDIIYLCPSSVRELTDSGSCIKTSSKIANICRKFKATKLKFIAYQNGNRNGKYLRGDYVYPVELKAIKKVVASTNNVLDLYYSSKTCLILEKILGKIGNTDVNTVPRTGCLAIFEALCAGAHSIIVEGMSFYNGGGHMFRKDAPAELDPLKNHLNATSPHNSYIELEFIKILLQLYPDRIIINNKYLAEILDNSDKE